MMTKPSDEPKMDFFPGYRMKRLSVLTALVSSRSKEKTELAKYRKSSQAVITMREKRSRTFLRTILGPNSKTFANVGKVVPLKARRSVFLMSAGFLQLCHHHAQTIDVFLLTSLSETVVKINKFQLSLR